MAKGESRGTARKVAVNTQAKKRSALSAALKKAVKDYQRKHKRGG